MKKHAVGIGLMTLVLAFLIVCVVITQGWEQKAKSLVVGHEYYVDKSYAMERMTLEAKFGTTLIFKYDSAKRHVSAVLGECIEETK